MKRTDVLLAALLILMGTSTFMFIENMFSKRTVVTNTSGQYIKIVEISHAIGNNRHGN
jgi:hypothetical protein